MMAANFLFKWCFCSLFFLRDSKTNLTVISRWKVNLPKKWQNFYQNLMHAKYVLDTNLKMFWKLFGKNYVVSKKVETLGRARMNKPLKQCREILSHVMMWNQIKSFLSFCTHSPSTPAMFFFEFAFIFLICSQTHCLIIIL